jgi:hypothetical protein
MVFVRFDFEPLVVNFRDMLEDVGRYWSHNGARSAAQSTVSRLRRPFAKRQAGRQDLSRLRESLGANGLGIVWYRSLIFIVLY